MNFDTSLQGIAALTWLVAIGLLVLTILRASRRLSTKGMVPAILGSAVLALVFTTLSAGLVRRLSRRSLRTHTIVTAAPIISMGSETGDPWKFAPVRAS